MVIFGPHSADCLVASAVTAAEMMELHSKDSLKLETMEQKHDIEMGDLNENTTSDVPAADQTDLNDRVSEG